LPIVGRRSNNDGTREPDVTSKHRFRNILCQTDPRGLRGAGQAIGLGTPSAAGEDPEAFRAFYQRHARAVLGFLYRRTASPETAADLTAETMAEAFLSRRRFRDTGLPARAWLFGIARHKLGRMLERGRAEDRARRRLGVSRIDVDEISYERIETLADFGPLREAVRSAVRALSPTLADAVVLRVGMELPYHEVARRLGCSEPTARVRVARGLSQLADMLEVS
jgi:RNA polymerase sigma factor (sigma-70 family)